MLNKVAGFFRALADVFSRERLEEDPAPPPSRKEGFLSWLLKAEELPKAAVSVEPPRTGILSWLLRPDELPQDKVPRPRSASIFSVIFGRERIAGADGDESGYDRQPPSGRKDYNRGEKE